jgi:hypothetical protein
MWQYLIAVASCVFISEGEDVLVARSSEEKYVVVDLLFWQLLIVMRYNVQNK